MEAELCQNFNLLPNCANHTVIGATRLPLGPICANQSFTSQAVPIQFRN